MNSLSIPQNDFGEFGSLPDSVKNEVRLALRVMGDLQAAKNIQAACQEWAQKLRGHRGWSMARMRARFYEWKRAKQDWRLFIDRAKAPEKKIGLPPDFLEWFRGLCEENQRGSAAAMREAVRRWKSGAAIPGYPARPPADSDTGLPRGWSPGNLGRFLPTKMELRARRIGRTAASGMHPLVFTTRVGLSVGEFYLFDDLWHDVKVNFLGVNRRAMRPLELSALDLFSGCKFAWGAKPMMEDEETQKRVSLKLHEMRFLLAHVLINVGYRANGTTLVVEHGTAAIPEDLENDLLKVTGGAVKVRRSGMEGAAAFAGAYAGRSKGNFRMKAALESHHALTHTELAALPGQMGSNSRLNAPEDLHGREKENDALLLAILADPELATLGRLPFLEFNHFLRFAGRVAEHINCRTNHDLEGWIEAGLIAYETIGEIQRTRRLSPREVFDPGMRGLEKISPHFTPLILGDLFRVERRVGDNGLFEFEDQEMGAGVFRYLARAQTIEGQTLSFRDGDKFLTQVNPFDPRILFVSDARGSYLGACPRWNKIVRSDDEAMKRQMGAAKEMLNERLIPLVARGREITRKRLEDTRYNAALVGNDLPKDRARKRALQKNFRSDAAELLDDQNTTAPASLNAEAVQTQTEEFRSEELL